MGAVTSVVGRVIVVVVEIVTMVGIIHAAVPKSTGQIGMVETNARVDEGNQCYT